MVIYKRWTYATFVALQFLMCRYNGETYIVSASSGYDCTAGASETCTIDCATQDWGKNNAGAIFNCGNAGTCKLMCTAQKCFNFAVINAQNTQHLILSSDGGRECFKAAAIDTGSAGNVDLVMPSTVGLKGFRDIILTAGSGTGNIEIECHGAINDDCRAMTVDAANAQYLHFSVVASSEFEESTIHCPESSSVSPSCVMDVADGGLMHLNTFYAQNGSPQDLQVNYVLGSGVFSGGDNTVCCGGTGTCDTTSILPMTTSSACYIPPTAAPTTAAPTTQTPTTAEPTTSAPTTAEPTTATPTTATITTAQPTTAAPTTAASTTTSGSTGSTESTQSSTQATVVVGDTPSTTIASSSSTSSTTSSTATETSTETSTASTTGDGGVDGAPNSGSSSGLESDNIVDIMLIVLFVVICSLLAALMFFCRRKKKVQNRNEFGSKNSSKYGSKSSKFSKSNKSSKSGSGSGGDRERKPRDKKSHKQDVEVASSANSNKLSVKHRHGAHAHAHARARSSSDEELNGEVSAMVPEGDVVAINGELDGTLRQSAVAAGQGLLAQQEQMPSQMQQEQPPRAPPLPSQPFSGSAVSGHSGLSSASRPGNHVHGMSMPPPQMYNQFGQAVHASNMSMRSMPPMAQMYMNMNMNMRMQQPMAASMVGMPSGNQQQQMQMQMQMQRQMQLQNQIRNHRNGPVPLQMVEIASNSHVHSNVHSSANSNVHRPVIDDAYDDEEEGEALPEIESPDPVIHILPMEIDQAKHDMRMQQIKVTPGGDDDEEDESSSEPESIHTRSGMTGTTKGPASPMPPPDHGPVVPVQDELHLSAFNQNQHMYDMGNGMVAQPPMAMGMAPPKPNAGGLSPASPVSDQHEVSLEISAADPAVLDEDENKEDELDIDMDIDIDVVDDQMESYMVTPGFLE